MVTWAYDETLRRPDEMPAWAARVLYENELPMETVKAWTKNEPLSTEEGIILFVVPDEEKPENVLVLPLNR